MGTCGRNLNLNSGYEQDYHTVKRIGNSSKQLFCDCNEKQGKDTYSHHFLSKSTDYPGQYNKTRGKKNRSYIDLNSVEGWREVLTELRRHIETQKLGWQLHIVNRSVCNKVIYSQGWELGLAEK